MNIDGGGPGRGLSQRDSASEADQRAGCDFVDRLQVQAQPGCRRAPRSSPYSTRRLRRRRRTAKRSRLEAPRRSSIGRHRVSNESASAGQVAAPTATLARGSGGRRRRAVQSARDLCSLRARRGCLAQARQHARRNRIRRCAPPVVRAQQSVRAPRPRRPAIRPGHVIRAATRARAGARAPAGRRPRRRHRRPARRKKILQCVAVQHAEIPGGVATRSADNATTPACGQRPSAEVEPGGSSPVSAGSRLRTICASLSSTSRSAWSAGPATGFSRRRLSGWSAT